MPISEYGYCFEILSNEEIADLREKVRAYNWEKLQGQNVLGVFLEMAESHRAYDLAVDRWATFATWKIPKDLTRGYGHIQLVCGLWNGTLRIYRAN